MLGSEAQDNDERLVLDSGGPDPRLEPRARLNNEKLVLDYGDQTHEVD